ncbi:MAG TPA: DUF305 domain-containing protein [Pseudolysinimonas sp.]|nr:DUF305 domain-containing protein [Pseudolysinimonas sp.]
MTRGRLIAGAVVVAVLLAAGGFLAGRLGAPSTAAPPSESAAAGFLRDMQVHHAQAVEMAMLIRDRSDDPALRQLAYDIAIGQAGQAGQMYGLLNSWGLPQASSRPPMSWMSQPVIDGSSGGHDMGPTPGAMPGMASEAELGALRDADGVEAERLFLTLMIAHHRGGLDMAEAVLARTTLGPVVSLANGIIASQTSDIEAMQAMLDARRP